MTTDNTELDDGLTDEERAALSDEDGGGSADDTQTNEEQTNAEEDDGASDSISDGGADDAEKSAAADGGANDQSNASPEPETAQTPQPVLVAQPVEDAEAKLRDIEIRKDALLTQFDDGDITAREYQKQLDALAKQERQVEFALHEANLAAKMEQQRLQNDWVSTCNSFIEANAIYKDNPRLYKALDQEVKDLAAKPETANWSGQKFLEEAHKNLKEAFGFADAGETKTPTKRPPKELPPNLAKVPSAEIEDTNGGKYAVLDRLANADPLAYEEALAKMPEAERNAYLAS